MKKHFYPAIFHCEDVGYSVSFPDLEGCFSEGDTIEQAYEMSIDALGIFLQKQDNSFQYPAFTAPENIHCSQDECVVLVEFDELEYLKRHENKSVKKTLTIPDWLNQMAEKNNINFSQCLQSALKDQLNVN